MNPATNTTHYPDQRYLLWVTGAALACVAILAYWPGLAGPFLFDDFGSIAALGNLGGVSDWTTFKAFVFGGNSGPTGRPLALLTFLLDSTTWPADPWPFKRTNLLIHIGNGLLIAVLGSKVLQLVGYDSMRAHWLGMLSAALWLLHPFLVSTTLYAVQRMAQLSALFILLGLISHLQLRTRLAARPLSTYAAMAVSMAVFTVLAMLSKENGVLLPLFIGVIELTVQGNARLGQTPLRRSWLAVFLAGPALLLGAYFMTLMLNGTWLEPNPTRGISIYERVLTESRVLFDYLRHWFAPDLYTSGVFQDHYQPSRGIFDPPTTAAACAGHIAIITAALHYRRRYPLPAFSVLFFYCGHLLESTVVNLELYFEHRNYLATAFLFLPVVALLEKALSRKVFAVAVCCILLIFTGFTRYTAGLWTSYATIVDAAAKAAPMSARAQQQHSQLLFNDGQYEQAMQVVDIALDRMPENKGLLLHRALLDCVLGSSSAERFGELANAVSNSVYDLRNLDAHSTYVNQVGMGNCQPVAADDVRRMFIKMLETPANADPGFIAFNQISFFIGLTDIYLGDPGEAVRRFKQSLESRPDARRAMSMAALLASTSYFDEALEIADVANEILTRPGAMKQDDQDILLRDIAAFRRQVDEAKNAEADESP